MADTRYWSKEFMVEFIDIYKKNPCLWKLKSKEYTNRNLKTIAYNNLIELCKTVNPAANRDFVVKKIQSIRGSFRKELKKVLDSKRSGKSTDDVYEPSLWYFDLLLFTKDQEIPQESRSNLTEEYFDSECENENMGIEEITSQSQNEDNNNPATVSQGQEQYMNSINSVSQENDNTNIERESQIDIQDDTPRGQKRGTYFSTIQKNKKRMTAADRNAEFMKACTGILRKDIELNEYDAIGINVGAKLKRMDPTQAIYADLLINKILSFGLLNKLTCESDISISNSAKSNFPNTIEYDYPIHILQLSTSTSVSSSPTLSTQFIQITNDTNDK